MFAARVMATVTLGGLIAGCQQTPKTPPPSSLNTSDTMALSQRAASYRAAHPGSEVGLVNAVLPERRIVSVEGLPVDRIKSGDVLTILGGNGKTPMEAVVYSQSSGYVQVRYEPLPAGQLDPMAGDLAVWYPARAGTPMSEVTPTGAMRMPPTSEPVVMPTTMPVYRSSDGMKQYIPAPATTAPAAPDDSTPPVLAPASRPAIDFNK
jgi:hypothetical protein